MRGQSRKKKSDLLPTDINFRKEGGEVRLKTGLISLLKCPKLFIMALFFIKQNLIYIEFVNCPKKLLQ